MMPTPADDLLSTLGLLSPDGALWCQTHIDAAKRLAQHAVESFPKARRSDQARILGLAVHVAERQSVARAIAAMDGVSP